jgi:hypothetical protein
MRLVRMRARRHARSTQNWSSVLQSINIYQCDSKEDYYTRARNSIRGLGCLVAPHTEPQDTQYHTGDCPTQAVCPPGTPRPTGLHRSRSNLHALAHQQNLELLHPISTSWYLYGQNRRNFDLDPVRAPIGEIEPWPSGGASWIRSCIRPRHIKILQILSRRRIVSYIILSYLHISLYSVTTSTRRS